MRIDRSLAEAILESALKSGARLAEVCITGSRTLKAEARDGGLHAMDRADRLEYSLRVIREQKLGFSYSNDPSDASGIVRRAMESLEFSMQDEHLDLPSHEDGMGYPDLSIHDADIEGMDPVRAIELAKETEASAMGQDPRVKRTRKSSASFTAYEVIILNSKGISHGYRATSATASVTAVAEDGGDSQMGWGYGGGRFLKDVDFRRAGQEAAERALSMLGAGRAAKCKAALLIDNSVAVDFLSVAASMLSAENVQKGKSLLRDRDGQRIMSQVMNIVDDPLAPGVPASRPMDGEGVRCRRNVLVSGGVLSGFMHNTYTAGKAGTETTANASRAGAMSLPGVGPHSISIEPSGDPLSTERMIGMIDCGMIVLDAMGVHTINPVSGDFSIGVSGISVRGGRREGPVKEAVISGNILGLLGSVEAVGDDMRFFGGIGSPSLLVTGIDLSA